MTSKMAKTVQRKYLLCGHIFGDDNADIKIESEHWCECCARELEHGHIPKAIKDIRGINN